MSEAPTPDLEPLLDAVVEDARQRLLVLEDTTARRRREILMAAQEHVDALERAADELGDVRGKAVEASVEMAAQEEVRTVIEGAFDRLAERFLRRVRLALEGLPGEPRYPAALGAWAVQAARRMEDPAEVFAAPRDREAVYDALLEAGARDFRVVGDHRVHCGFVVRDLDGRTVIDRRPDALLEEHAAALRRILEESAPPPPRLEPASRNAAGR